MRIRVPTLILAPKSIDVHVPCGAVAVGDVVDVEDRAGRVHRGSVVAVFERWDHDVVLLLVRPADEPGPDDPARAHPGRADPGRDGPARDDAGTDDRGPERPAGR